MFKKLAFIGLLITNYSMASNNEDDANESNGLRSVHSYSDSEDGIKDFSKEHDLISRVEILEKTNEDLRLKLEDNSNFKILKEENDALKSKLEEYLLSKHTKENECLRNELEENSFFAELEQKNKNYELALEECLSSIHEIDKKNDELYNKIDLLNQSIYVINKKINRYNTCFVVGAIGAFSLFLIDRLLEKYGK